MLIEAAVVTPVFLLMIFAIMEFGGLMMDYGGAANVVRAGVRTAAVQGNQATADAAILVALSRSAANLNNASLQRVVIWHATGPGDSPPAACTSGSGVSDGGTDKVGACNVYVNPTGPSGAFALARSNPNKYFGCNPASPQPSQLDCNWPGQDRWVTLTPPGQTTPSGQQATPDYIGIWVKVNHHFYTNLFGATKTITDQAILPLEPQQYSISQ